MNNKKFEYEDSTDDVRRSLPPVAIEYSTILWWCMTVTAVVFSLFLLYYAKYRPTSQGELTVITLGLGFIICILYMRYQYSVKDLPAFANNRPRLARLAMWGRTVGDSAIMAVTLYATYYFYTNFSDLHNRLLLYTTMEYLLAAALVVCIIIVMRRAYGNFLTGFTIISFIYAYGGPWLPGFLRHNAIHITSILEASVLTFRGAYGFIPQTAATWIAIFLVYMGLLEGYGALDIFFDVGRIVGHKISSGPAQIAVISSLLMGAISGSAAANTATTGSFTIPFMKEQGLDAESAGGIESSASSGGQLMPPIMGAAAFVMASILNIPYLKIVAAGILPAILFYISIAFSTHLICLKQGITQKMENSISILNPLVDGFPIIVSLVVLIYYLAWLRYDPMSSALSAVVILVPLQFVWNLRDAESVQASIVDSLKDTIRGLQIGATTMAPLLIVIAGIGIIVEMISIGGLTQDLTFLMLNLSQGSLIILLFLTMLLAILFGMGLPTVAAYVLVALLVGPTVAQFGLDPIYGHMYVFYFAILSALSPPVALACVVACGISGGGFLGTCKKSLKVAAPGFVLPYSFVIHRELLEWKLQTVPIFLLVLAGMLASAVAFNGYFTDSMSAPLRVGLIISAVLILLTNIVMLNIVGALLVGGIFTVEAFSSRLSTPQQN